MTVLIRAVSNRLTLVDAETETFKVLTMLGGAGLVVSLIFASYGFDLSSGF